MKSIKALSILGSVTILTPLVSIFLTPIILQFYTKADFGELAYFTAFATVLGGLATGRLEALIPGTQSEFGRKRLSHLSIRLCVLYITFLIIPSCVLAAVLFDKDFMWLSCLTLAVICIARFNILTVYSLTEQYINNVAKAKLALSVIEPSAQIIFAFLLKGSAIKLILAFLFGQLSAIQMMSTKLIFRRKWLSIKAIKQSLKKKESYLAFASSSYLANTLALHGMPILFVSIFGAQEIGEFTVLQRTIGAIFFLASSVFTQYFIYRFGSLSDSHSTRIRSQYLSSLVLHIIVVGLISMAVNLLWPFASLWLPKDWVISDQLFAVSSALFAVQAIIVPLSSLLNMLNMPKWQFMWDSTRLLCIASLILIGVVQNFNFIEAFSSYVILMTIFYVLLVLLHLTALKMKMESET